MKYKKGDRFKHLSVNVEGEITRKIDKNNFFLEWEDGDKKVVSKQDINDDIKCNVISFISSKPKKKRNKLEKRVEDLEEKLEDLQILFDAFKNSNTVTFKLGDKQPIPTEKVSIDLMKINETPSKKVINPDKTNNVCFSSEINPFEGLNNKGVFQPNNKTFEDFANVKDKTLEERLRDLGLGAILKELGTTKKYITVVMNTSYLDELHLTISDRSDDEIVEKVKQIIEILK